MDVLTTLHARTALRIGFVPLTEALDLTTPAGQAFAVFLAGCAECERGVIREWIKAGMRDARKRGKAHGRPRAKNNDAAQVRLLAQQGLCHRQAGSGRCACGAGSGRMSRMPPCRCAPAIHGPPTGTP